MLSLGPVHPLCALRNAELLPLCAFWRSRPQNDRRQKTTRVSVARAYRSELREYRRSETLPRRQACRAAVGISPELEEPTVFSLCLPKDGNLGVSMVPEFKKVLVCCSRPRFIP